MAEAKQIAMDRRVDALAFVASVASGTPSDTAELVRKRTDAVRAEADAEALVQTWIEMVDACDAEIAAKDRGLDNARRDTDEAAKAVIATEAPSLISATLSGFDELEREIVRRAAVFKELDRLGTVPAELQEAVDHALRQRMLLPYKLSVGGGTPDGYDKLEVVRAWSAAVETLKADPAAPLPGAG